MIKSKSGVFDGICLVSDIDGTFLGAGGQVVPANIKAVEDFKARGGRFTFATGREAFLIRHMLGDLLSLCNLPVICANGAILADPVSGVHIEEKFLPSETALPILRMMERRWPRCRCKISRGDEFLSRVDENPPMEDLYNSDRFNRWYPSFEEMPRDRWNKILVIGDPAEILEINAELRARFPEVHASSASPGITEINAPSGTKGAMIRRLRSRYALSCVWAIGDGGNDESMLLAADRAATPASGIAFLREIPEITVTVPNQDGAVADLIRIMEAELQIH